MKFSGLRDLVRDPGGQLAQGGQLLAHHDLVLGAAQVLERLLELHVLALQLLGQTLHQVQPLHLKGVTAEHLQRGGHVGHLVAAADLDPRLQVAARHAAHPVGQHAQPAQ